MTKQFKQIAKPVEKEFVAFEQYLKAGLKTNMPLLSYVTGMVMKRKLRMFRPVTMLLLAKEAGKPLKDIYIIATIAELMHAATLIHQDVTERNHKAGWRKSFQNLWKSKVSVLLGDFLLTKGLLLAMDHKHFEILEKLSSSIQGIVEARLLHSQLIKQTTISFNEYENYIQKQSIGFYSAYATSILSSGNNNTDISAYLNVSREMAKAYHIKQDIEKLETFKRQPALINPDEIKILLPLILGIENAGDIEKVNHLLSSPANNVHTNHKILDFILKNKGIESAHQKINECLKKMLEETEKFKNNEIKNAYNLLVSNFLQLSF